MLEKKVCLFITVILFEFVSGKISSQYIYDSLLLRQGNEIVRGKDLCQGFYGNAIQDLSFVK